jgi:hypothetical protein
MLLISSKVQFFPFVKILFKSFGVDLIDLSPDHYYFFPSTHFEFGLFLLLYMLKGYH